MNTTINLFGVNPIVGYLFVVVTKLLENKKRRLPSAYQAVFSNLVLNAERNRLALKDMARCRLTIGSVLQHTTCHFALHRRAARVEGHA